MKTEIPEKPVDLEWLAIDLRSGYTGWYSARTLVNELGLGGLTVQADTGTFKILSYTNGALIAWVHSILIEEAT